MKTSLLQNGDAASAFYDAVLVAKWAAYGNGANFRPCLRPAARNAPLTRSEACEREREGEGAKPLDAARGPVARWLALALAGEGVGVGWLGRGPEMRVDCCSLRCAREGKERGE